MVYGVYKEETGRLLAVAADEAIAQGIANLIMGEGMKVVGYAEQIDVREISIETAMQEWQMDVPPDGRR